MQVGGSIGLAVVGTVAWSAAASSLRSEATAAARTGIHSAGAKAAALQSWRWPRIVRDHTQSDEAC